MRNAALTIAEAAEQMIWKGRYLEVRLRMMRNRLCQITNRATISMPTIATKNQHGVMLPRSEAIIAKKIVPSTIIGKIAPISPPFQ